MPIGLSLFHRSNTFEFLSVAENVYSFRNERYAMQKQDFSTGSPPSIARVLTNLCCLSSADRRQKIVILRRKKKTPAHTFSRYFVHVVSSFKQYDDTSTREELPNLTNRLTSYYISPQLHSKRHSHTRRKPSLSKKKTVRLRICSFCFRFGPVYDGRRSIYEYIIQWTRGNRTRQNRVP